MSDPIIVPREVPRSLPHFQIFEGGPSSDADGKERLHGLYKRKVLCACCDQPGPYMLQWETDGGMRIVYLLCRQCMTEVESGSGRKDRVFEAVHKRFCEEALEHGVPVPTEKLWH
jgi:hypothetical protein